MGLTLVILAAGMGSRYGGLKQLDEVGPSGETVMDYSVFDAIRAGFDRVVFVIRRDIEEAFKSTVGRRYSDRIKVEYVFQELHDLPNGFKVAEGRTKPFGTGHALYATRAVLKDPFAVINADDFYGQDSYKQLAGYLRNVAVSSTKIQGCIVSFLLAGTLSENGSVSRGICASDSVGNLAKVVENTKIFQRADGRIVSQQADNVELPLTGQEQVSMNCWGFMPEMISELERLFIEFLKEHGSELKSEFYLPFAVDALIREGKAEIKLLRTSSNWFGVTYREDKERVQLALRDLVDRGIYPSKLFD